MMNALGKTSPALPFSQPLLALRPVRLLLAAAVLMTSVLVAGVPAQAGQEVLEDGVLHVKNGPSPSEDLQTVDLVELWRAGGEDDEEVFFGLIPRVMADGDGNIFLLDSQLSEVKVFSPDGEFLKTLSREGEGPGEVRNPNDFLFMPDGTLGLAQQFPGKIVKVDLDGDPAGEFTPGGQDPTQGGFFALVDARSGGGHLVLGGIRISVDVQAQAQNRTYFLASFDAEGHQDVLYHEMQATWGRAKLQMSEEQFLWLWRRWAITPEGKVLVPFPRNEYAIEVFNPDGTLDRVIEREYTSWPRSDGGRYVGRMIIEAVRTGLQNQDLTDAKLESYDTEADIQSIRVAPDGSIWILSSRGVRDQADGVLATFDVFDPAGNFRRQVALRAEGDGTQDGIFFAGADRVIVVTGFVDALASSLGGALAAAGEAGDEEQEAAPMSVICYQLP